MYKHIVYKGLVLVKAGSIISKISLFCTAISTVATLLDTIDSEMGWAIDILCVAVYLFAKNMSFEGYDKTAHIPPVKKRSHYSFTSSTLHR